MMKLKKVTFNSLKEIQNHNWVGNAYHDMPAFIAINKFIIYKASSTQEACLALDTMSKNAMGIESNCTPAELKQYLEEGGGIDTSTIINFTL